MTVANNVNIDAIVVRIQKLLALSQSPNEHEAALAAAKAQDLLFRYNLSMVDVDSKNTTKPITERYNNRSVTLGSKRDVLNWKRDLIHSVARYNFCRAITWAGSPSVQLIGKPTNIEVVLNLFDYLTATIDRLSAEGWECVKRENGGKAPVVWSDVVFRYVPQHAKNYRSSFSHGAVSAIINRLAAQRRESEAAAQSSALVVIADEELREATESFYGALKSVKVKRSSIDEQAYGSGKEAGKRISLNDQVGSGSAKALRG